MSLDNAASKYLAQLTRQNYEAIKEVEMVPISETFPIENVILLRASEPRFFAGVKRNGQAVWTHDIKLARPVSEHYIHHYEERLGEALLPMWPYQR